MDTERDLLFGVLTVQMDLISPQQLAEATALWRAEEGPTLADRMTAAGWITGDQRSEVERLLERKLAHHGGDVQATLAAAVDPQATHDLGALTHGIAPGAATRGAVAPGHVLLSTVGFPAEGRERYTLTRLHATGGIGQVWLARDSSLGREVALKELRPGRARDPFLWSRFLEEARITGQLEHPGIVPIYELSRSPGDEAPFYTMRFVRGRTFGEAIKDYHRRRQAGEAGPLDLAGLLNAFIGVCNAVAFAHSRGVIHRDLKPQNVVLGDYGEVIVLDWGLAKMVDRPDAPEGSDAGAAAGFAVAGDEGPADATRPGQVLGTPAYMPPEQAEGQPERVGRHSDIYSLGAILYEILVGQPPHVFPEATTTAEMIRRVREAVPTRPRARAPATAAALEAVCLRALAREPEGRYASAADLAREIQRWLADEPVAAYREPLPKRAGRWARRHKPAVAAAVALMVTGVVALSVAAVLIRRERNEARLQRQVARQAVDEMYTDVAEQWLEDRLDDVQRRFLEKALGYYERFARQESRDPVVRQERGRAHHRMAEILRKLGRHGEAEAAYRQATEILEALVREFPGGVDHLHHLAQAHTQLGLTLSARGAFREAESLFRRAVDSQQRLARGALARPAHRLHLARASLGLADLHRRNGRSTDAEAAFRRAVDELESLVSGSPTDSAARQELAVAQDHFGLLLREHGRPREAEAAYRRALALQEALAAEFPTLPRHRESLAKSLSSLGLFLASVGQPDDAEAALRRALAVDEVLAHDFPLRPEYRRGLARSHINLALRLEAANRRKEAEDHDRQAVAIYEALVRDHPTVLQYRQDLARLLNNLGVLLKSTKDLAEAERSYRRAIEVDETLAADAPDVTEYREALAGSLGNLGDLLAATGRRPDAEAAYRRAIAILEPIVAASPTRVRARETLSSCYNNLAGVLFRTTRPQEAEAAYRRAVALLGALAGEDPATTSYRTGLVGSLSNLALLQEGQGRFQDAEPSYRRALAILEALAADAPTPRHRELLASVRVNLGELLAETDRRPEAEGSFEQARGLFEALAAERPDRVDLEGYLGVVLQDLGELKLDLGQPAEARRLLEQAIGHQKAALAANPRHPAFRQSLRDHHATLARALLATGDHAEAVRVAGALPPLLPDDPEAQLVAAQILGRCLPVIAVDPRLPAPEAATRARAVADAAIARLREATGLRLERPERLEDDPAFNPLWSRDDFVELLRNPPE